MKIRTAVLTAAKRGHTHLPLQTMIDREGYPQTALSLQLRELIDAGIERVGIVVAPGQAPIFREAVAGLGARIDFIEQPEARGFGDAVRRARDFVQGEAFLLVVGDHLFISTNPEKNCARQLLERAAASETAMAAVQATHESEIGLYGTIGGVLEDRERGLFRVRHMVEKPTPTQAEVELLVPGLRSGHYLCFFGLHVLPARIFDLLDATEEGSGPVGLTPALERLAQEETFHAFEIEGRRYNLEARHGLLLAQLALALNSRHREEILEHLVRLLAKA